MDRNGYNPSIIQRCDVSECFLCGVPFPLQRHEIFGAANRGKSKQDGLWICVCPICHAEIHSQPRKWMPLKAEAQAVWCLKNGKTADEFRERYGRNYD